VLAPLEPPADVKVEGVASGVRVAWAAPPGRPGLTWRVLRGAPDQEKPELLGPSSKPEYVDSTAQFGKTYQYSVQTAMKAGDAEAESAVSKPVAVAYIDRFPPAVPAGLTAVAGVGSIQLVWNPDTDPDLKGYYMFRFRRGPAVCAPGRVARQPQLYGPRHRRRPALSLRGFRDRSERQRKRALGPARGDRAVTRRIRFSLNRDAEPTTPDGAPGVCYGILEGRPSWRTARPIV